MATVAAQGRLRRALQETVAPVDRLQFEFGAVPRCLAGLDERMAPLLHYLHYWSDAYLDDAE